MNIIISETIRAKLQAKHEVSPKDVHECFLNRLGIYLVDDREQHRTDPPTLWFIARNNHHRMLKVCFLLRNDKVYLRTCFPPSSAEIALYESAGGEI